MGSIPECLHEEWCNPNEQSRTAEVLRGLDHITLSPVIRMDEGAELIATKALALNSQVTCTNND
jgi:hypothetical protein